MTMKKILLLLICSLLCVFPISTSAENSELVENGGFENGLTGWKAQSGGVLEIAADVPHTGNNACLIDYRNQPWDTPMQDLKDKLNAIGPSRYEASAYVKAKQGEPQVGLILVLNIKDDDGTRWISSEPNRVTLTNDYQELTFTKSISWKGELAYAYLYCQAANEQLGAFYVDDYSFKQAADQSMPEFSKPDISERKDKTLVGAIRWDAWMGDTPTGNTARGPIPVGQQVEATLSPEKYHFRVPWYGEIIDSETIKASMASQEIIDRETRYAKAAGIDYFAYCYYNSPLRYAKDAYLGSFYKNSLKYCYIFGGKLEESELSRLIREEFPTDTYQKTTDGRCIINLFPGRQPDTAKQLKDAFRSAGLKPPYIVSMGGAVEDWAETGTDCASGYTFSGKNGVPYADIIKGQLELYEKQKSYGIQVVPIVSTGWDNRTRGEIPTSWDSGSLDGWVQQATPAEIAESLQQALNWNENNKESTVFNSVIVYAWNEFDEGGWIEPTLFELRDSGRPLRLDAVRDVLIKNRVKYSDLNSVSWAKDSIGGLAISGTFKGISETAFEPDNKATRAQYLGWLVRSLGLYASKSGNFDDITGNIYADEIEIAKSLGLTTGVGDNKFNPDGLISRQDVMVMTARALNKLELLNLEKEVDIAKTLGAFSDNSSISDYAKGSVALMADSGLMKGDGTNINPLSDLTRAESAVLLYRILEID